MRIPHPQLHVTSSYKKNLYNTDTKAISAMFYVNFHHCYHENLTLPKIKEENAIFISIVHFVK